MQEIKIVVGKGGKIIIDVDGIKGSKCSDLTKKLEKAFGKVTDCKKKGEFYQQETQQYGEQKLGGNYGF